MYAYGLSAIAVNALAALLHHVDFVIVGRTAGTAALGVYQVAYKIPEVLIALPIWVAGRVLFPVFARLKRDGSAADVAAAYVTTIRYIGLITIPGAIALGVLAEPIVRVAFGEKWLTAVPILRALAAYGCLRSIGSPAGDVMKALGRPGLLAGLGIAKAAMLVPMLVMVAGKGPVWIAVTLALVTAVTAAMNQVVVSRLLGVSVTTVAPALTPGVVTGLVFAVGSIVMRIVMPEDTLAALLVSGLVGATAGALALRLLCPDVVSRTFSALTTGTSLLPERPYVGAPPLRSS
jgi:PST family polysaccharide transporter